MNRPIVKIVLLDGGAVPQYATTESAGVDLKTTIDVSIDRFQRVLVPTGIKLEIPSGFEAQVRPRSGLAIKHGLSIVNSPGTIDSDYRGEIQIILINLGESVVKIEKGERIAQLVFAPVVQVDFQVADQLNDSERGSGGFGRTGKN